MQEKPPLPPLGSCVERRIASWSARQEAAGRKCAGESAQQALGPTRARRRALNATIRETLGPTNEDSLIQMRAGGGRSLMPLPALPLVFRAHANKAEQALIASIRDVASIQSATNSHFAADERTLDFLDLALAHQRSPGLDRHVGTNKMVHARAAHIVVDLP